jgi:DNA-binding beta-propeller fold protein YncE
MLFACKPVQPVDPNSFHLGSGVLILNEGVYQFSDGGSLTFYDPEADTVANKLFYKANGIPIGDVPESMALLDGKLYIVVNSGNYIYKVDANTVALDTTKPYQLCGFYSPREMQVVAPNKAYVSDLIGKGLWIINPQDMTHCGFVDTGKTTEKIVQVGNELYVSNWSNYYFPSMEKNTVQVVDINNDVKVAEITVGKEPNTMVVDKNGHVWVLCEGATWQADGEKPTMWEIDPMLKTAHCRYTFEDVVDPETGEIIRFAASNMKVDPTGRYFYVIVSHVDEDGDASDSEVRRFDMETQQFSETFCISSEGDTFYNMAVEPNTGEIYVSRIGNPVVNGTVYRYTADGVLLSSFEAGIFPSAMLFK